MQLQKFQELIASDPSKLISKVKATRDYSSEAWKQIEPENHLVRDKGLYKDREVWVPRKDANGQPVLIEETQEEAMQQTWEPVARISAAIQKDIVNWAVKICAGEPIDVKAAKQNLTPDEQKYFDMVIKTIKDNKFDYLDSEILRLTCTYKICAEIWFSEECDSTEFWGELGSASSKWKLRVLVVSQESGDLLYPMRDDMGKMYALGREYKFIDDDDASVDRFDLYTETARYTYAPVNGSWELIAEVENKYKKGNFVVYEQQKEEWADVQPAIERIEIGDSRLCDSNDVVGSPILAISGKVEGFGKRGETGKVFEMEHGGKMEIVEADGAPEAVKMERDNLMKAVYQYTATPNISFDDAKGFGANMPGITLKLLFLPATLKAMNRQRGGWGMSVQRRINFIAHCMPLINPEVTGAKGLDLNPVFSLYMPQNDTENYQNIIALCAAGLISKKTGVKMLGLVEDPEAEWAAIQEEAKALAAAAPPVQTQVA
jgi:SPP1 family phage portal protein